MFHSGVTGIRCHFLRTIALAMAIIFGSIDARATDTPLPSRHPIASETQVPSPHPMATDGMRAFAHGQWEEANEKLSNAMTAMGVPTLALFAARTNIRLNHWVKAAELYVLASRLNPHGLSDIGQLQAQHDAQKERAELLARVPRLTVTLQGDDLDNVNISLDSEGIPKPLLGANQLVDPGHHVITAERGGQRVTLEFDVDEYQHKTATLHFARLEPASATTQTLPSISTTTERVAFFPQATAATPPAARGAAELPSSLGAGKAIDDSNAAVFATPTVGTSNPSQRELRDVNESHLQRNLGWTGIGLGAAGLLLGTAVGLAAVEKRSAMNSSGCHNSSCYADSASDVDSYNAMRTWSSIGFVTGSLFAVTGLTLLMTAPKHAEPRAITPRAPLQEPDLRLGLVPGAMALSGRF